MGRHTALGLISGLFVSGGIMDNQHQKIKGYRDLTEREIELMNLVKTMGGELEEVIKEISDLRTTQMSLFKHPTRAPEHVDGLTRPQLDESGRCINRAEDSLKTGIMWLVRSVALPNGF